MTQYIFRLTALSLAIVIGLSVHPVAAKSDCATHRSIQTI